VFGGAVFRPWDNVAIGVIGGYDDGKANLDWQDSIGLKSYRFGAMGAYDNGALFASGGIALAYDRYALQRQTFVPQLQSAADANGNTISAFGAAGYRFTLGAVTAGPLLALRYTNVRINPYNENGAPGLDMIVQSQRADELIGSAGIAAATQFRLGAQTVRPYLELALEKNLLGDSRLIDTALVTVPDVVRTLTVDSDDRVFGRLSGGISFGLMPGITGGVSGETTIGRAGGNEHAFFVNVAGKL
jgi:outer membrane lipase/esterase